MALQDRVSISQAGVDGVLRGEISQLVSMFGKESQLEEQFDAPLCLDFFIGTLTDLMESEQATVLVAYHDSQAVGLFIFLTVPHPFTGLMVSQELVWYVHPEFRGTSIGPRLFQEFERLAKEYGSELAMMVHLKNSMPERLAKFYVKKGYLETETTYTKRL